MDKSQNLLLAYEEFGIKADSDPAWKIIDCVVERIIGSTKPFKGWLYHYDSGSNYYVKVEEFEDKDKHDFPSALRKYIYKAALCMIRTNLISNIEQLLSGYSRVSSGIIDSNLASEVFSAPVELGEWAEIDKGQMVLLICHDGDPLFVLKNSKQNK
jgi:hypothetical protein